MTVRLEPETPLLEALINSCITRDDGQSSRQRPAFFTTNHEKHYV